MNNNMYFLPTKFQYSVSDGNSSTRRMPKNCAPMQIQGYRMYRYGKNFFVNVFFDGICKPTQGRFLVSYHCSYRDNDRLNVVLVTFFYSQVLLIAA